MWQGKEIYNRLMEIRRTLPAAIHATLYSSASPIVSPPSACSGGREGGLRGIPLPQEAWGGGGVGRTQDCLEAMTLGVLGAGRGVGEFIFSCAQPSARWTAQALGPFPLRTQAP